MSMSTKTQRHDVSIKNWTTRTISVSLLLSTTVITLSILYNQSLSKQNVNSFSERLNSDSSTNTSERANAKEIVQKIRRSETILKHRIGIEQTCQPKRFVFLKNHKSGSSTMRSMFINYQILNKFTMNLKVNGVGPWLGGWPAPFEAKFYKTAKTDVIYDHLRWNMDEINKVLTQSEDTMRISIVRDPVKLIQSSYNFFYASRTKEQIKSGRGATSSCIGSPFLEIAKTFNHTHQPVPLSKIIEEVREKNMNLSKFPYNFRLNNSQSRDFNYLSISEIAEQFDFLMVLERLPESLVILKKLLCMEWENVVPYGMGQSRKQYAENESYQESDMTSLKEADLKFMDQNLVDSDRKIYDYADRRLDYLIEIYGSDNMKNDLDEQFSNEIQGFRPKQISLYLKKKNSWRNGRDKKGLKRIYNYSHGPDWDGECKVFG